MSKQNEVYHRITEYKISSQSISTNKCYYYICSRHYWQATDINQTALGWALLWATALLFIWTLLVSTLLWFCACDKNFGHTYTKTTCNIFNFYIFSKNINIYQNPTRTLSPRHCGWDQYTDWIRWTLTICCDKLLNGKTLRIFFQY